MRRHHSNAVLGDAGNNAALTFAFRGTVADVDCTRPSEPHHPSTVAIVAISDQRHRVIIPAPVLAACASLLEIGREICVFGEVHGYPRHVHHIATELAPAMR